MFSVLVLHFLCLFACWIACLFVGWFVYLLVGGQQNDHTTFNLARVAMGGSSSNDRTSNLLDVMSASSKDGAADDSSLPAGRAQTQNRRPWSRIWRSRQIARAEGFTLVLAITSVDWVVIFSQNSPDIWILVCLSVSLSACLRLSVRWCVCVFAFS